MKLSFTTYRIFLKHTFGISRSSNNWYDIVLIFLQDGKIIGRGEAAPSARYNESKELIKSILDRGVFLPENCTDRNRIWEYILPQLGKVKSLEAAFSMALWDWWGQKQDQPLYELLGLDMLNTPMTSYTIAIGDISEIEEKVNEANPYAILKVKLGTLRSDKLIINEIRKITDKVIRVDANEGWDLETAIYMCKWLADRNVEFIEQPFPSKKLDLVSQLSKISPLEIFADENSINSKDIPDIKKFGYNGINIKLMKCGSIEEAMSMVKSAKFYDMKIMLGCMVETSVGITAASHLAGEVDAVDLDGNLLITNDPYKGVGIKNGRLVLPPMNGIGLKLESKNGDLR